MGVIEVNRGDNGALVINASTAGMAGIAGAVMGMGRPGMDMGPLGQVQAAMASWANSQQGPANRRINGMFERDRYVNPRTPIARMQVARDALEDDVIGGAADGTENLAINGCYAQVVDDIHQEDVWNQMLGDWDMDSRLRECWRDNFTVSTFVMATWWERKTYKSRLPTDKGNSTRKTFNVLVPTHLTLLDAARIAPVGALTFGQEHLAYIAEADEGWQIDAILARRDGLVPAIAPPRPAGIRETWGAAPTTGRGQGIDLVDPIIERLMVGRYQPSPSERVKLQRDGVDCSNLFLLDDRFTFRHTRTRSGHERFSRVRLGSVFPLLDIKEQLRQLERAHLIGGASYIVLVTLGSDQNPAQQPELAHLRASVQTIGQIPVIVGDHRLNIEIVTPKMDTVLSVERHDTLDTRLQARAWGSMAATGKDTDDPVKLGRVVAAGLNSQRHQIARTLEGKLFQAIRDNNPDDFTARAELMFHPKTIALSFDSAWASFLLDLREANEISRDTVLSAVDLKQGDEAAMRERERDLGFDDTFETINPHGPQPGGGRPEIEDPDDPDGGGGQRTNRNTRGEQRRGGRRAGRRRGGAAPGTRQGQESADPRRSDTGGRRSSDAEVTLEDLAYDEAPAELLDELDRKQLIAIAGTLPTPLANRHHLKRDVIAAAILDHTATIDTTGQEA